MIFRLLMLLMLSTALEYHFLMSRAYLLFCSCLSACDVPVGLPADRRLVASLVLKLPAYALRHLQLANIMTCSHFASPQQPITVLRGDLRLLSSSARPTTL